MIPTIALTVAVLKLIVSCSDSGAPIACAGVKVASSSLVAELVRILAVEIVVACDGGKLHV